MHKIRRTRLYLPGNNPSLIFNAGLFGADTIILDLEDSVPVSEKYDTRIFVRHALEKLDFGRSETSVRINPLTTEFGEADLREVLSAKPDMILLPKCETADDVLRAAKIMDEFDAEQTILIMPILETAKGIINAHAIATSHQRVQCMAFGGEDFSADIGAKRTAEGWESFSARSMLVLAARAANVQPLDTVFSDVDDEAGLIASVKQSISLGFEGRGVIHPRQIEPIHHCFAPTAAEIEKAQAIVNAMEEAKAKGLGAVSLGRKMIDPPVAARAERILKLAKMMGASTS